MSFSLIVEVRKCLLHACCTDCMRDECDTSKRCQVICLVSVGSQCCAGVGGWLRLFWLWMGCIYFSLEWSMVCFWRGGITGLNVLNKVVEWCPLITGSVFFTSVRSSGMCHSALNVSGRLGPCAEHISLTIYCIQLYAEAWTLFCSVQNLWSYCLSQNSALIPRPSASDLVSGALARLKINIFSLECLPF